MRRFSAGVPEGIGEQLMNRRGFLTVTVSTATLLAGLSTLRVDAQFVPPQQGGRVQGGRVRGQQGNRPFGQFNNRQQNVPYAMATNERMRRLTSNDPSRSAANYLLTRNDVRSELSISTRQREALEELNKKAPQEMMDQFRNNQSIQQMQERMRQLRNLPEGERRVQREQMRQEMRQRGEQLMAEFQNFQSDLDKRAEEILTPAQVKRLHQLDLQYRGGLALANPKLAQEFALTPEQSQQINQLLEEFRQQQRDMIAEAMGFGNRNTDNDADRNDRDNDKNPVAPNGAQNQNQNQANTGVDRQRVDVESRGRTRNFRNNGQSPRFNPALGQPAQMQNPQQMQLRLNQAQAEVDRLRKTLGNKALALLNQEQAQYWKTQTGRTFTFRVVD
jgi:hypothetical protein